MTLECSWFLFAKCNPYQRRIQQFGNIGFPPFKPMLNNRFLLEHVPLKNRYIFKGLNGEKTGLPNCWIRQSGVHVSLTLGIGWPSRPHRFHVWNRLIAAETAPPIVITHSFNICSPDCHSPRLGKQERKTRSHARQQVLLSFVHSRNKPSSFFF